MTRTARSRDVTPRPLSGGVHGASSVYVLAAFASLLLSLFAIWQNDLINHDGVLYLRAIEGDAEAIRWIGNWLFYSKLIGALSAVTGLAPESSAYLVNTLLDLLLVLAFLRFVEELGGRDKRTLTWAAILVLILPYLNGNRAEIIRDHGYWAFTLAALIFWLRLLKDFSWKWLSGWYLAMTLATLFRVEGAAFLALMPLGLLLQPVAWKERFRRTILAWVPLAAAAAMLFGTLSLLNQGPENRLTELLSHARQLTGIFTREVPARAERLAAALPDLSRGSASMVLYLSVLFSIAKDLAQSLSWPLAFIVLLRRWFPAPGLPEAYARLIIPYAAVSLLVLFVHGSQHFVMVSRYTMALALALLPVAVFALEDLWRRHRRRQVPAWLAGAVFLSLLGLAGDSLINSTTEKPYITKAARWAAQRLPPGSRVITDYETTRLGYYAEQAGGKTLRFERFKPGKSRLVRYQYAFVRHPDGALAARLAGKGRKIWSSGAGRRDVTVYELTAR